MSEGPGEEWREYLLSVPREVQQAGDVVRRLLRDVVAHGVAAVGAAGGSVLVPESDGVNLRFLVSHGPGAERLDNLKVPIQGSIVGCVFSTGQMTVLADLEAEAPPIFYANIGKQIGISTRTYMVVPLLLGERIWGAATYVNRPGNPPYRPFEKTEMNRARAFAQAEAVLLRLLERGRQMVRLASNDLEEALASLGPAPEVKGAQTEPVFDAWGRVLREMERLPEAEQGLCAELIEALGRRHRGLS